MNNHKTKVRFWYKCRHSPLLIAHVQAQFGGRPACDMTVNGEWTLRLDEYGLERLRQLERDGLVHIRQIMDNG